MPGPNHSKKDVLEEGLEFAAVEIKVIWRGYWKV